MRTTTILIVAIALGLPLACSRDEARDAAATAEGAVAGAADTAKGMAAGAAETAKEAAAGAADATKQAADDVAQAAGDVMGGDAAAQCRELAAKAAWAEALEACTKAHEEKPDDMAIEHALQQAQAAAAQ